MPDADERKRLLKRRSVLIAAAAWPFVVVGLAFLDSRVRWHFANRGKFGFEEFYCFFALVGGTPMLFVLVWLLTTRREKPWACRACRYDRAGLAADAPCPECGRVGGP